MGSPLGPVLADKFMCNFEDKWIISSPRFHTTLWYRYVDDTFPCLTTKTLLMSFWNTSTAFTIAAKSLLNLNKPKRLRFWTLLLIAAQTTLSAHLLTEKKIFTGFYTKWHSFTRRKYKINLIRMLSYRCFRLLHRFIVTIRCRGFQKSACCKMANLRASSLLIWMMSWTKATETDNPNEPVATVPQSMFVT